MPRRVRDVAPALGRAAAAAAGARADGAAAGDRHQHDHVLLGRHPEAGTPRWPPAHLPPARFASRPLGSRSFRRPLARLPLAGARGRRLDRHLAHSARREWTAGRLPDRHAAHRPPWPVSAAALELTR
eukprot:5634804-Prymnesium_polylepis.1